MHLVVHSIMRLSRIKIRALAMKMRTACLNYTNILLCLRYNLNTHAVTLMGGLFVYQSNTEHHALATCSQVQTQSIIQNNACKIRLKMTQYNQKSWATIKNSQRAKFMKF